MQTLHQMRQKQKHTDGIFCQQVETPATLSRRQSKRQRQCFFLAPKKHQ